MLADAPTVTVLTGPDDGELSAALDSVRAGSDARVIRVRCGQSFLDQMPSLRMAAVRPGAVLLLTNVHNVQPDAVPMLEALIRSIAASSGRCVCGVRLPLPPASRAALARAFDRLWRDGLVQHVNLRPVPRRRFETMIIEAVAAVPEPAVVARLAHLTGRWPWATRTALKTFVDNGSIRVVDRNVYLTATLTAAGSEDLVAGIRALGDTAWNVAKALAVLHPLGEVAPGLIAHALRITEDETRHCLVTLARAGVLRPQGGGFRRPLVADALKSVLGPYERRRLAEVAIHALWNGSATCEDPCYLADRLADAGRLVDAGRAKAELLESVDRAWNHAEARDRAIRWLGAAAELASEPAERARILSRHVLACMQAGDGALGLASSEVLLTGYAGEIHHEDLLDVCFVHLTLLHQAGEFATLTEVAEGRRWPWPGNQAEQAVGRAFACARLGRWRAASNLLRAARQFDGAETVDGHIRLLAPTIGVWLGAADEFNHDVATVVSRNSVGETTPGEVDCHVETLLTLEEDRRAEKLLVDAGRDPARLGLPAQSVLAFHRGAFAEALELTRKSAAAGAQNGCDPIECAMYRQAATLLLLRGNVARARELVALARERQPALPHLLSLAESISEETLGDSERAEAIVRTALDRAEADGVVALTDLLWIRLADLVVSSGRTGELPECLRGVERVAGHLGTESAEVARLSLRAMVHADLGSARAGVHLARRRTNPLEMAGVLVRLVRGGVADPKLLLEAYSAVGDTGALMFRAWLRTLMPMYGVPVPGRRATAENERLLAVLVSEGLRNKEIAMALRATEKSVEGRLSRLFLRTGCRSRVELATAMLTGQVDGMR